MKKKSVIAQLAEIYPQLYLDPDQADQKEYKACVTRGERPSSVSLSHFDMDERDCMESVDTPAGSACVITLYSRHDFEVFVRCMMAARQGPLKEVPAAVGASTLTVFNWQRINAHKDAFFAEQKAAGIVLPDWNAEFDRFTSVKENYMDMLIVLSCGPYSNVSVQRVNEVLVSSGRKVLSEEEWQAVSGQIRKYHELTHFVCRRLYPEKIDAIWDELAADALGIYGAFSQYSRQLEELFLGITENRYTGGRLEHYTEEGTDLDLLSKAADAVLRVFETAIASAKQREIYDIMIMLEQLHDQYAPLLRHTA